MIDLPPEYTRRRKLVPAQWVGQVGEYSVDRLSDGRADFDVPPPRLDPFPPSPAAPTRGRRPQMPRRAITRNVGRARRIATPSFLRLRAARTWSASSKLDST